jgi:dipeptidyl aminopeptidase/acylaminoacyl peptidase
MALVGMRLALLVCALAASGVPATKSEPATARNGLIVYVHQAPRNPNPFSIWVIVDESGSGVRRLLFGPKHTTSPHWSADGRRLVFRRASGVYVAAFATTRVPIPARLPPRRIARFSTVDSVDWSPDGTSVVLTMAPRRLERRFCTELYTMRTDRSELRRLTATTACEANAAWSPDGLAIAFEREEGETTEIIVTDVRGRTVRMLGEGTFPAWSPDGRWLAFLARQSIVIVDTSTGSVQRTLTPDLRYDELEDGLTWSPDSARLAHGFNDVVETKPVTHIAVIDVDGSNASQLTPQDTFPDMEPDWQPICDVYGTDGDDMLTGTPGDDLICGLRGNDRIRAGAGSDTALGGDGADSIVGGPGADRLFGAAGNDRLYARDTEPDLANGGPGSDRLWGDDVDTVSEVEDRHG